MASRACCAARAASRRALAATFLHTGELFLRGAQRGRRARLRRGRCALLVVERSACRRQLTQERGGCAGPRAEHVDLGLEKLQVAQRLCREVVAAFEIVGDLKQRIHLAKRYRLSRRWAVRDRTPAPECRERDLNPHGPKATRF
jgi:hypothetical protein